MDTLAKAKFMNDAFAKISDQFVAEGKTELANQTNRAVFDVPDSSMAKLYDIVQRSFFLEALEAGSHVNIEIDGIIHDAFVSATDRDRGGFLLHVAKGGDEFDTVFAVDSEILPA